MTDTAIEKSATFSITSGIINIDIDVEKFTTAHLRIGTPPNVKSGDQYQHTVLFYLVVIPKDLSSEQIRMVSDVERLGGKIIQTPSSGVTFTAG